MHICSRRVQDGAELQNQPRHIGPNKAFEERLSRSRNRWRDRRLPLPILRDHGRYDEDAIQTDQPTKKDGSRRHDALHVGRKLIHAQHLHSDRSTGILIHPKPLSIRWLLQRCQQFRSDISPDCAQLARPRWDPREQGSNREKTVDLSIETVA